MRDSANPPGASGTGGSDAPLPLFRQQAIDQISVRQYGSVLLTRAVSHTVLTALFVVIAVAIVAFFMLFNTTRKAQCQGVLLPTAGVIRILPTQTGIVQEVRVKDGQAVNAGDVLFVLSSERSSSNADATQKTISALLTRRRDSFDSELTQSAQQSRQRLAAAHTRARDIDAEIHRTDDQIVLQQRRVALAEQAQKRYDDLQASHFISAAQLQDKQAELLDQQQRLAELRRVASVSQRDLAAAQADARDVQVQGQRDAGSLQRDAAKVEQDLTESESRRELLVRAPQAGVVTAIAATAGQNAATSTALASLLPAGAQLQAEIYAPSRSIGFIKPGMTVLLRYQAYPYQKFGQHRARVAEVAMTSLRPDELAMPGVAGAAEPLYRIRLKLDAQNVQAYGKSMPLKSGMLVDASVLLEQRRLYEWVLEPLFSIAGRM